MKKIQEVIQEHSDQLSFYVSDTNGSVAEHNSDTVRETASCIKVFILIEFYNQVNKGAKSKNDKLLFSDSEKVDGSLGSGILKSLDGGIELTANNVAKLMIISSDNIATNMMIDYLGIDNINQTIKDLGFSNTKLLCKLDFSKICNIGSSTAKEYGQVFQRLLKKDIINETISNQALEVLKLCQGRAMINKGIPPADVGVYKNAPSKIKYIASKSGGVSAERDNIHVNVRNDVELSQQFMAI